MEDEEELELDISDTSVVTKYKAAAEIANFAMQKVVSLCTVGAKIVDICEKGDNIIQEYVIFRYY